MDVLQALRGHHHRPRATGAPAGTLVAGATGALGNALLQRLAGSPRYGVLQVLAREAIRPGMRSVHMAQHAAQAIENWPLCPADIGLVLFDPPRMHYQRERALWTPTPAQLPELAAWMQRCGVRTLAIVLPHDQGRLPPGLQQGLANLDEQAVATLGFERLLIVRSARKPDAIAPASRLQRLANALLGTLSYMLPASQAPVRASKVAEFTDLALRALPPGIHIAPAELVWRCGQGPIAPIVQDWLGTTGAG